VLCRKPRIDSLWRRKSNLVIDDESKNIYTVEFSCASMMIGFCSPIFFVVVKYKTTDLAKKEEKKLMKANVIAVMRAPFNHNMCVWWKWNFFLILYFPEPKLLAYCVWWFFFLQAFCILGSISTKEFHTLRMDPPRKSLIGYL